MTDIFYNQVRQKGSHNSYQRDEGYLDQALYWRIRSLEIDIHNSNHIAGWPMLHGDWYVYHIAVLDQTTSVNTLSDALDVLNAFHRAIPNHEVITLWLDLKDDLTTDGAHTPKDLDALLVAKLGREQIWGPPDLIGESSNLQQAIVNYGWPTLKTLQGKFIFACTTGDLSSPSSHLNQYVDNGQTANTRLAFVAPQITSIAQLKSHNYAVVFNLDSDHAVLGKSVFEAGFISRAYGLNSQEDWCRALRSSVHHLTTNKVNALQDEWARTDIPATGYPFSGLNTSIISTSLTEPGTLYAIQVNSGDIWNSRDSFYYQYDDHTDNPDCTIEAMVGNPRSHVDGWIKAGIMARTSTNPNAAYVAVLRTGSHGIRMQSRMANGHDTDKIEAQIPNGKNGRPLVGENTPIWIRLTVSQTGQAATGSYSIDGFTWQSISQIQVTGTMTLQGWAASSHGSGEIKWLVTSKTAPSQAAVIGSNAQGSFITSSMQAASLGPKSASAECNL